MLYDEEKLVDAIVSNIPDKVIAEFEDEEYAEDFASILGWDKFGRPVFVGDVVTFSYGPTHTRAVVAGDGGVDHNGDHRVALDGGLWPTATFGSIMVLINESPNHKARFVRDANGDRVYVGDRVTYEGDLNLYEVEDLSADRVYMRPTMVGVDAPYLRPLTVPAKTVIVERDFSPIRER